MSSALESSLKLARSSLDRLSYDSYSSQGAVLHKGKTATGQFCKSEALQNCQKFLLILQFKLLKQLYEVTILISIKELLHY